MRRSSGELLYIYTHPVKGTRGTWNLRVFGALYGVVYKLLGRSFRRRRRAIVREKEREREIVSAFSKVFDLAIDVGGRDRGERGSIPLLASTDPATYAGARKLKLERKWARGSWRILARGRGWNLPCGTSKREREGEGDG